MQIRINKNKKLSTDFAAEIVFLVKCIHRATRTTMMGELVKRGV